LGGTRELGGGVWKVLLVVANQTAGRRGRRREGGREGGREGKGGRMSE
jgi:hypothetical protein